jgi:hypothetical protein
MGCDHRSEGFIGGRFLPRPSTNAGVSQEKTADPKAGGDVCGRGSYEPHFRKAENAVGRKN